MFYIYLASYPGFIIYIMEDILKAYEKKIKYIGMKSNEMNHIRGVIRGDSLYKHYFAAEGILISQKILKTDVMIESLMVCPELILSREAKDIVSQLIKRSEYVYIVSRKIIEKLSERDKANGFIVIGVYKEHDLNKLELKKRSLITVLDGLMTPGNIGTILRSCDGAGVDAVFICNCKVRLTNIKLVKGSMGALFNIPVIVFESVTECITWLIERNFDVCLADSEGTEIYRNFYYRKNTALVLGSEGYGISKMWYRYDFRTLSIPMSGICDSLNVGTAASVIIYDMTMKRKNPSYPGMNSFP